MILCTQTLVRFLHQWELFALQDILEEITCEQILDAVTQIFLRTALTQASNDSWDRGSCEITAYAVLILIGVSNLSWAFNSTESYTSEVIEKDKQYLRANRYRWDETNYIWIEKVIYIFPILSQAYCLAVMKALSSRHCWLIKTIQLRIKSITKLIRFFNHLFLFFNASNCDLLITVFLAKSYTLLSQIIRIISDIFPRDEEAEKNIYEIHLIHLNWL